MCCICLFMTDKSDKGQFSSYRSLLSLNNAISKKTDSPKKVSMENSRSGKRSRSKSPQRESKKGRYQNKSEEKKENYDIPDRSYGDLYCKACDSHMNSDGMWDLHVQGKRHLKSIKSLGLGGGGGESVGEGKYIYLDQEPEAQAEIDAEKSPIVGLQHVCEIIRLEQKPIYNCFLCNANVPNPQQLIVHLLGLKHRMAYLKEHDKERYDLIQASNLKKGQVEPVVEECVAKLEVDKGRGKVVVKKEKPKTTHTWGVMKPSARDSDSYSRSRSEREDKDYFESERRRASPHHSEKSSHRGYEDRDIRHSYSPTSSERNSSRERERVRSKNREFNRDADYYERRVDAGYLSEEVRRERSHNLSSTVGNRLDKAYESNSVDLREILQQKKMPSVDNNISDTVLGIFSALPTISFFKLVLFKLDNMVVEEDIELRLLDRVVNKASALAESVKTNLIKSALRMQFQESLAKNGSNIESDRGSAKDVLDLLQMVGECKAMSSARTQNLNSSVSASPYETSLSTSRDAHRNYYPESSYGASIHETTVPSSSTQLLSYSGGNELTGVSRREPEYHQPVENSQGPDYSLYPKNSQGPDYSSYAKNLHGSDYSSYPKNSQGSDYSSYPKNSQGPGYNSYPTSYSSPYSSSYSSIPGLTLTEHNMSPEKDMAAASSPFVRLQSQAKNIFGNYQYKASNVTQPYKASNVTQQYNQRRN